MNDIVAERYGRVLQVVRIRVGAREVVPYILVKLPHRFLRRSKQSDVQISNILSNTDPAAIDSFTEAIADYTANGNTIQSNLDAEVARAQAAEAAAVARLDAIEAMLVQLQSTQ